jgi:hypothetical protein
MKTVPALATFALLLNLAAVGQQEQRFRESVTTARRIQDVFATGRLLGSVQLDSACRPKDAIPDFPQTRGPKKPYEKSPADTLQYMFSIDPEVMVSKDGKGFIRIATAGVQADILHVQIKSVSFNAISDPGEALAIILNTPEIQSFVQAHGIGQPSNSSLPPLYLVPGVKKGPARGMPNVSGELKDVRLTDALDYLLKTFPGFWLYQNCQGQDGQRIVYFGLFPTLGRMWAWGDDTLVK